MRELLRTTHQRGIHAPGTANLADEAYWYANALAEDNIVRYTGLPRTYGLVFDYNLNGRLARRANGLRGR